MQLISDRGTWPLPLLVRQRNEPQAHCRTEPALLRPDLLEAEGDLSSPLHPNVPRRSMSPLHVDGPYPVLLLREALVY